MLNQKVVELRGQLADIPDPDEDKVLVRFEVYREKDGAPGEPELSVSAYTSEWTTETQVTTTSLPDGVYYWRVRAKDDILKGLEAEPTPWRKFTVDTKGLTAQFMIAEGDSTRNTTVHLQSINIQQGEGGGTPAAIRVRTRSQADVLGPEDGWSKLYPADTASISCPLPSGDGLKVVEMQVQDAAQNWGGMTIQTVRLDTTPPQAPTWPSIGAVTGGNHQVKANWKIASDGKGSGIADYEVEYSKDGVFWSSLAVGIEAETAVCDGLK